MYKLVCNIAGSEVLTCARQPLAEVHDEFALAMTDDDTSGWYGFDPA